MKAYIHPSTRLVSLHAEECYLLDISRIPTGGVGDFDTRRQEWEPNNKSEIWADD